MSDETFCILAGASAAIIFAWCAYTMCAYKHVDDFPIDE